VTANPLAGFEDRPFHEAIREGEQLFAAEGYPSAATFRQALADGRLDVDILESELADHGYEADPETLLDRMAAVGNDETPSSEFDGGDGETATDRVDQLLTKWLAAFLDQDKAHWPMPDRERLADLPDAPVAAIEELLTDHPEETWPSIFEFHLTALPGWTGFIKQRIADGGAWQSAHPITLAGYLAVRLALTDLLGAPMAPPGDVTDPASDDTAESSTAGRDAPEPGSDDRQIPLPEVWLSAWEATYRRQLVEAVTDASVAHEAADEGGRPDAQLVFCIDTRSEIIRRHVEAAGDYETHGYAGFFGVQMRYEGYDADVTVDACPPILDAEHRIADRPTGEHDHARNRHDRWSNAR